MITQLIYLRMTCALFSEREERIALNHWGANIYYLEIG